MAHDYATWPAAILADHLVSEFYRLSNIVLYILSHWTIRPHINVTPHHNNKQSTFSNCFINFLLNFVFWKRMVSCRSFTVFARLQCQNSNLAMRRSMFSHRGIESKLHLVFSPRGTNGGSVRLRSRYVIEQTKNDVSVAVCKCLNAIDMCMCFLFHVNQFFWFYSYLIGEYKMLRLQF